MKFKPLALTAVKCLCVAAVVATYLFVWVLAVWIATRPFA